MKRFLIFIAIVCTLISCETTDHEGFKRLDGSIHYRLNYLGDEEFPVSKSDYVSFKITAFVSHDSLVAVKKYNRIKLSTDGLPNWIQQIFLIVNSGDSLELIGNADELEMSKLFSSDLIQNEKNEIRLLVKFSEALSEHALRELLANERLIQDLEIAEQLDLERLRDSLNFTDTEFVDGIYFQETLPGNGKVPSSGAFVKVNYKTKLPNGVMVDNTYLSEPLEYEVGKPDQVLPGFSIGISKMSEGSEAIFVIPSHLAFGERGSSSGLIPPYSAILYEVKLLKVRI